MRAPSSPHSARPFDHRSAVWAANSSGETPACAASDSSIHGRKSSGFRSGNSSSRFARSPFGSTITAGIPSSTASSISATHSPVLPEPVIPTQTAWVTRSFES